MQKVSLFRTVFFIVVGLFFFVGIALADEEWTSISGTSNIFNTGLGRVGIGTSSPWGILHIFDNGSTGSFYNDRISNDSTGSTVYLRKARGTLSSPAAVQSGDQLGKFTFSGYNGTAWVPNAITVRAHAAENWTSSANGSRLLFTTTDSGTTNQVERMRIESNGNVGIGTTNPSAKLSVIASTNGFSASLSGGNAAGIYPPANKGLNFSENFSGGLAEEDIWNTFNPATYPSTGIRFLQRLTSSTYRDLMFLSNTGNVGIGTTNPQSTLAVNGTITTKKVKVTEVGWSDFVFEDSYKLPTLAAVESHIKQYKHLPGIPSAREIKQKGLDVSDVLAKQMQKIEELTLYMIEMQKENQAMQKENQNLKNRLNALEKQVTQN